jgi:hypothetical protein
MSDLHRDIYAYAFDSSLTLEEMQTRLTASGIGPWFVGDNERWDEYISIGPLPEPYSGSIRLFFADGSFVANVRLRGPDPGARERFAGVRRLLLERMLPTVLATNIRETDDYE